MRPAEQPDLGQHRFGLIVEDALAAGAAEKPETRASACLHRKRHVLERGEPRQHRGDLKRARSPSAARAYIGSAVTSRPPSSMRPASGLIRPEI